MMLFQEHQAPGLAALFPRAETRHGVATGDDTTVQLSEKTSNCEGVIAARIIVLLL